MVKQKGPGDIKSPTGKPKAMKKMPDGNPFPYEREHIAIGGISDDLVTEGKKPFNYSPKPNSETGEDGKGGHK